HRSPVTPFVCEEGNDHFTQQVEYGSKKQHRAGKPHIRGELKIIVVGVIKKVAESRGLVTAESESKCPEAGACERVITNKAQIASPDPSPSFCRNVAGVVNDFKPAKNGIKPNPEAIARHTSEKQHQPQGPSSPSRLLPCEHGNQR